MQTQEIINVNIWLILISLCNLVILFLILKKFLFKPVKKVLAERQAEYDAKFAEADGKLAEAEAVKAERILKDAKDNAERRGAAIVTEAKDKADLIVKNAESEAELRRRKAEESIKDDIADVSVEIAEKIIGREVTERDHRRLVDEFINKMGDEE